DSQGRLLYPALERTPNFNIPSSTLPAIGEGDKECGQRSARFANEGCNRIREWTRIYKSALHNPQKDWRRKTCPKPESIKPVLTYTTLQDGDNPS
ncbi:hypothetical protein BX616_008088, partial [Lobosporangium transversale]